MRIKRVLLVLSFLLIFGFYLYQTGFISEIFGKSEPAKALTIYRSGKYDINSLGDIFGLVKRYFSSI